MKTGNLITAILLVFSVQLYAQDENKVISKFDFIPGDKIIFYDDFSSGNIGDFPASWNTSSSGEIVTIAKYPGRWLQLSKGGFFIPEAKEKFTDLINRVAHSKERIILTRRGKEIAAIVPVEDIKVLEVTQDKHDLHDAIDALKEARHSGTITLDQLKEDVGA